MDWRPGLDILESELFPPLPPPRSNVATFYGLDSLGIESRWGSEIFCTRPESFWALSSLL